MGKKNNSLSIGLSLGLAVGYIVYILTNEMIFLSTGLALGISIGMYLDQNKKG